MQRNFLSEDDLKPHQRINPYDKCDKYVYADSEDKDLKLAEECEEMFES